LKDTVKPYKNSSSSKKEQVAEMFDNIAGNYDFLNHFLSLGIDIFWRKQLVKHLTKQAPKTILDVATGTNPDKVIGVDISNGMLEVGRKKMKEKSLDHIITLEQADSEDLPYEDETFDAVCVSFGARNFENLEKGLSEMRRVLREGGKLYILEFSQPTSFPFKQIYQFYFKAILPLIGKVLSKDNSAYSYLPESVSAFPHGKELNKIIEKCGYTNAKNIPLTLGISSIYIAKK
jgi:demethylmenaquinone methyltransferase/2-methoxy-6-polyprenyl-1,4-benzoquinol methylase